MEEQTPRQALLIAIQISREGGYGGYADRREALYGQTADMILRWLANSGFDIVHKESEDEMFRLAVIGKAAEMDGWKPKIP